MQQNALLLPDFPTMKSIDQPKKQEKVKELPADLECACNTCPSKEACKAAQEASSTGLS